MINPAATSHHVRVLPECEAGDRIFVSRERLHLRADAVVDDVDQPNRQNKRRGHAQSAQPTVAHAHACPRANQAHLSRPPAAVYRPSEVTATARIWGSCSQGHTQTHGIILPPHEITRACGAIVAFFSLSWNSTSPWCSCLPSAVSRLHRGLSTVRAPVSTSYCSTELSLQPTIAFVSSPESATHVMDSW